MGACINDLEQNLDRSWNGRSFRTGEVKNFKTLGDYEQYVSSLETNGTYCAEIEPKYTNGYTPGKQTAQSGFLQFQERDPVAQSKYSAMSPNWEGVKASESAITKGMYDLDSAEKTRQDLRGTPEQVVLQMPEAVPEPTWNCAIQ